MKTIIKILILLFIPVITMAAIPIQQLENLFSNFNSMQANFVQILNNSGPKTSGVMSLQRPDKFRWQVEQPNKQIIIVDGANIWIYDVDLEQAVKQKIDSQYAINPTTLLSGSITKIQQHFIINRLKTKKPGIWFELKPKQQQEIFQSVQLQFINQRLKSMRIIDNIGNHSTITFSNVRINPRLKPALFRFKAPAGVDVIEN